MLQTFSYRQYPGTITVNSFRDEVPGSLLGPTYLLSPRLCIAGPTSTNTSQTQVVQPPHLGEVQQIPQSRVTVDPADQELLKEPGLSVQGAP